MSGKITAILGRRGGGKTLLMTHLAKLDFDEGSKIVSNYHLNFDYTYMTLEQVAKLPDWLKDATVCLDEIQVGADSREIFKKGNKSISTLATQLRKRNITLYFTTQLLGQVDKRLRDQTDYVIITQPLQPNEPTWFKIELYDKRTDMMLGEKFFYGAETFDLYNTNEVIKFGEELEEDELDEDDFKGKRADEVQDEDDDEEYDNEDDNEDFYDSTLGLDGD